MIPRRRSHGPARLLHCWRAQGGHYRRARGAGPASLALHVGGQGAQVLPDRRPAADPGRSGRRADLPRARVAAGRLRGAVRPGAARDPARRVDAVLPLQPGRATPHPRADTGRQADRDLARPGGAGAFELDPPVVRGPGPGRRLRPGLRRGAAPDRGRLGGLLVLHRARALRGAARASLYGVRPGAGLRLPLPGPARVPRPGPGPDLRLPRRADRHPHRAAPGERHGPPAALVPAPGRVQGTAHQHRGEQRAARRGHRDRLAGTNPAAGQPAPAAADLGAAPGAAAQVRR